MKKLLAILLATMLIMSSVIAVNAESIKDIFGTEGSDVLDLSDSGAKVIAPRGGDANFIINSVEYDGLWRKTLRTSTSPLAWSFYTGYTNNKSTNDADYDLTILFRIKGSADATTGSLIIPLDKIYARPGAVGTSTKPYFKNFEYQVGDSPKTALTVKTGPVAGISGTNKYLSIPLSKEATAETNLNARVFCTFEQEHVGLIKKDQLIFDTFYTTINNTVNTSIQVPLTTTNCGLLNSKDPTFYPAYYQQRKVGYIYRGYETQFCSGNIEYTAYNSAADPDDGYTQIPLIAGDNAFEAVTTFSPGVQVTLNETGTNSVLTGNVNTGYTLTTHYGKSKMLGLGNATLNSYGLYFKPVTYNSVKLFVPANQTADLITITSKVTVHTLQGDETSESSRTINVIDPIQDLNDKAFYMHNDHYCLDLGDPSFVQSSCARDVSSLTNEGILPIKGVSYTFQNDSNNPANVTQLQNNFRYYANWKVYIKKNNGTTRTTDIDDIYTQTTYSVGYTDSSSARYIKLNEGEWIDKVESVPYYLDGGTKVYSTIKGEDSDIVANYRTPVTPTFMCPPNNKNIKTGAVINSGEYSNITGTFYYEPHYTYNGQARVDTVGSDSDSSGVITRTNKLYYVTGETAHNAFIQVTENANISVVAPSGTETRNINACLYLYNGLYNGNNSQDRPTYNQQPSANWVAPIATVVFPEGIKLNTSALTSAGTNKYTTTSTANGITRTITITKLANSGNKEVWRFSFDAATAIKRYDTSGTYSPRINPGVEEGVNVPLTVTSAALGGGQLFDIYTSSGNTTPFIAGNTSSAVFGSTVNYFLGRPTSYSVVTDTYDYDGDSSTTDKVVEIKGVYGFKVNTIYQIDGKSQYKKTAGGQFTDVDSDAILVNIGTDVDFRVILTNAGNAVVTNMKVTDTFPNFYTGGCEYVQGSLVINVLDKNGNVTKTITNATISGTTAITVTLPVEEELLPGYSLQLTGKFKVRDDARPNLEKNSTISLQSKFDGSFKTSTFNQAYKTEDATTGLRINVFLDYNDNGVYDSNVDKPLSSASVNTRMTNSDDNRFNDTKTLTNTVPINYTNMEYGTYTTTVTSPKDENGHTLSGKSVNFEITLAETRAGTTKVVDVPIVPRYIGELHVKYVLDNSDQILYESDTDQLSVPTNGAVAYNANILGTTKYALKAGESNRQTYSLTLLEPSADIIFIVVPVDYTVTYRGNGGKTTDNQESLTETHGYNTTVNVKPGSIFTRTGYSFTGWTASGITLGNNATSFVMPDGNVILTAQWRALNYKVEFDPNGHGTPSPTEKTVTYDSPYGALATISATGYTFGGWYMNADCTGSEIKATTVVKTAHDHTLYAKWTPNEYTIIFDGNGSTSGQMDNQDFTYDVEQKLDKNEFEKTGYTFSGWKDDNGNTYEDEETIKNLTSVDGAEITLKAQWTPNQYKVTFDPNGHGTPDPTEKMVTYDSPYGPLATISEEGYVFGGWYLNAECTGNAITAQSIVKTAGDHTLYAKWSLATFKVIYNGNDGTIGNKDSYEKNAEYMSLVTVDTNDFENTGYVFVEWNTKADGSGTTYDESSTFKMPAHDVTLYAQWEKADFVITYIGNGGFDEDGKDIVEEPYTLSMPAEIEDSDLFTRKGYEFIGWSLEQITKEINDKNIKEIDLSSFYQPNDLYLDGEPITLYAVWKKIDDGEYMDITDTEKNTDTTGPGGTDTSTEKDSDDTDEPVPSKPLYGDVDCNGKVDMEDVVALQKIMAKLATHEQYGEMSRINSDCVHDDVINMMDVTEIQKFLAKLIPDLDP